MGDRRNGKGMAMRLATVLGLVVVLAACGCRIVVNVNQGGKDAKSTTTATQAKEVPFDVGRAAAVSVMPGASATGGNVSTETTGDEQ